MKKFILSVLMATTLLLPTTQVFANQGILVYVDGSKIIYDSEPVIENGTTLVPLRQTFEALYADIDWNPATKTVTADRDDRTISLTIGNTTAYVNGGPISISVPPKVINGRTYVPLRFIAESFGADVDWIPEDKTVFINSFYDDFEYDPNYKETEYVSYNTSDLGILLSQIAYGNVVVINGEYYATPEYATAMYHAQNRDKNNDNFDRVGSFDDGVEEYEWTTCNNIFRKQAVEKEVLEANGIDVSKMEEYIPDFYEIYAFYDGYEPVYFVPDMTDAFMESEKGTGTFSGIKVEWDDGNLFFYVPDLDARGIDW